MGGVITFEYLTFGISILGVTFGVYHFFRNPQIKSDNLLTIFDERIKSQQILTDKLNSIETNHLHTIEENIKSSQQAIRQLELQVAKVNTILEERLPAAKK